MRKFSRVILVAAGFAAVAPLAANAAPHPFFTPSSTLVQEIDNTYGTSFKAPPRHATMAARQQAHTHRAG